MNLQFKRVQITLQGAEVMTLDDSLNATISCVAGSLWVTQDGDPRDVILHAGQKYQVDRASRVVVYANTQATLEVASGQADARTTPRLAGASFLTRLFAAALPEAATA
jgi:hypothetical protein